MGCRETGRGCTLVQRILFLVLLCVCVGSVQRRAGLVVGVSLSLREFSSEEVQRELHNLRRSLKQDYRAVNVLFCIQHEKHGLLLDELASTLVQLVQGHFLFARDEDQACGKKQADRLSASYLNVNISAFDINSFRISDAIKQLQQCEQSKQELRAGGVIFVPSSVSSAHSAVKKRPVNVPTEHEPYHSLGQCQWWWPLNHSELLVHSPYLPAHLWPLRMRQKIILNCLSSSTKPRPYLLRLYDHSSTDRRIQTIAFNSSQEPQLFEATLDLRPDDLTKTMIVSVTAADGEGSSAEMVLVLDVALGNAILTGGSAVNNCPVHPLASQLDSRDDLGFALGAILPNASSFLEVGVQHGFFAVLTLNTWSNLRSYVAVDAWRSWNKSHYLDLANNEQQLQDEIFDSFLRKMRPYGDLTTVLRMESLLAAALVADESIDVVYIDAMHHYEAVWKDLHAWWPKVSPGGLLAGHDYLLDVRHGTLFTVKPAVQRFARLLNLVVLYTDDDGKDGSYPSWFIYKPC